MRLVGYLKRKILAVCTLKKLYRYLIGDNGTHQIISRNSNDAKNENLKLLIIKYGNFRIIYDSHLNTDLHIHKYVYINCQHNRG